MRLCEVLKKTGAFDDLEIKVISAMLSLSSKKIPKNTASAIAREAKMPVTNVYKYLYSLEKKGIAESITNKDRLFWLSIQIRSQEYSA